MGLEVISGVVLVERPLNGAKSTQKYVFIVFFMASSCANSTHPLFRQEVKRRQLSRLTCVFGFLVEKRSKNTGCVWEFFGKLLVMVF